MESTNNWNSTISPIVALMLSSRKIESLYAHGPSKNAYEPVGREGMGVVQADVDGMRRLGHDSGSGKDCSKDGGETHCNCLSFRRGDVAGRN
jgi:hypothetical protein